MIFNQNKSVTLIELIIAVSLVAVIILGINSISIFSHYQVVSSDRRAKLQNEVSYSLDHMTKHISMAIGDISNDPIAWYDNANHNLGLRVRTDSDKDGIADTGDTWIGYRHVGNQIVYCPNDNGSVPCPNSEVISSDHILTLALTRNPIINPDEFNNLGITVGARWDPSKAVSQDNPEVSMQATVNLPSVSTN